MEYKGENMIREIKNSSGKIIGETIIEDNKIIIKNNNKPDYELNDIQILQSIDKPLEDEILIKLYDFYFLTCGEIASIYGVNYSNINKRIKNKTKTGKSEGRRNSTFGKHMSEERRNNIANSLLGHKPIGYIRTPEIKEKISKSLKEYFKIHPQNPEPHRKNWREGKYNNVIFHRGVGGKFYSIKNQKEFVFRSLLELYYLLQLENNEKVYCYEYEPFHIICDNGTSYTPDLIINGEEVIELKSKRYIESNKEIKEKFEYKKEQGLKYCSEKGLLYRVIFDEDLNYDSKQMKKYIKDNPDIIEKYQISFVQNERVYGQ